MKVRARLELRQFFYVACSPIAVYGLLNLEVFRDHTQRHTTVGPLCTSDQPVAEAST